MKNTTGKETRNRKGRKGANAKDAKQIPLHRTLCALCVDLPAEASAQAGLALFAFKKSFDCDFVFIILFYSG